MNASEASYIWGIPSGKFFEPCSLGPVYTVPDKFLSVQVCTDRACVYTIPPYPYKYLFVYPDKNLYCYESVQVVNLYG